MIDNNLNANNPNASSITTTNTTSTTTTTSSPPSPYEEAYMKWKHDNSVKHLSFEEQLDKAIDNIDNIKSLNDMSEAEFTDKVKPYVDKINRRKFKQYAKYNIWNDLGDDVYDMAKVAFGDIFLPSVITGINYNIGKRLGMYKRKKSTADRVNPDATGVSNMPYTPHNSEYEKQVAEHRYEQRMSEEEYEKMMHDKQLAEEHMKAIKEMKDKTKSVNPFAVLDPDLNDKLDNHDDDTSSNIPSDDDDIPILRLESKHSAKEMFDNDDNNMYQRMFNDLVESQHKYNPSSDDAKSEHGQKYLNIDKESLKTKPEYYHKYRIPGVGVEVTKDRIEQLGRTGYELLDMNANSGVQNIMYNKLSKEEKMDADLVHSIFNPPYDATAAAAIQQQIDIEAEKLLSIYAVQDPLMKKYKDRLVDVVVNANTATTTPQYRNELRHNPELLSITHNYIESRLKELGVDVDGNSGNYMDAIERGLIKDWVIAHDDEYGTNIGRVLTLEELFHEANKDDNPLSMYDLMVLRNNLEQITFDKLQQGQLDAMDTLRTASSIYKSNHDMDPVTLQQLENEVLKDNANNAAIRKALQFTENTINNEGDFRLLKQLFTFKIDMSIWKNVLRNIGIIGYNAFLHPYAHNIISNYLGTANHPYLMIAHALLSETVRDTISTLLNKASSLSNMADGQFWVKHILPRGLSQWMAKLFSISWKSGVLPSSIIGGASKHIPNILNPVINVAKTAYKYSGLKYLIEGITSLKGYIQRLVTGRRSNLYSAVQILDEEDENHILPLAPWNKQLKILEVMSEGAAPAVKLYKSAMDALLGTTYKAVYNKFIGEPDPLKAYNDANTKFRNRIIELHDRMINGDDNNDNVNDKPSPTPSPTSSPTSSPTPSPTPSPSIIDTVKDIINDMVNNVKDEVKDEVKKHVRIWTKKAKTTSEAVKDEVEKEVKKKVRMWSKKAKTTSEAVKDEVEKEVKKKVRMWTKKAKQAAKEVSSTLSSSIPIHQKYKNTPNATY